MTIFAVVVALGLVAFMASSRVFIKCGPGSPASSVMNGIEIGIKSYKTEYLRLPNIASSDATVIETRGPLLAILLAEDTAQNSRQIRFWDPPGFKAQNRAGAARTSQGEWELRDPWGNFYRIQLDVDEDGRISNPAKGARADEPDVLISDVIVYSAGADGDFATWKDNVRSWQ